MRSPELPSNDARVSLLSNFPVVCQRTEHYLLIHKKQTESRSVNSVYYEPDKYGPDLSISKVRKLVACITIFNLVSSVKYLFPR